MLTVQHENATWPFSRLLMLAAAVACLILSACASGRGGSVPYDVALGTPDVEVMAVSQGPQRIAPLDKLQVTVFQVEKLSGEFQVDSSGAISFPLIGSVAAQGKTPLELRDLLEQRLGKDYLRNPSVQVSILESNPQSITVDGSVSQPGVFEVKGPVTLMRAIALARGVSEDGNPSRVVVFRTVNGERQAGSFDLADIRRAKAPDPVIYGNDVVIVDGSRARALFKDLMSSIPLLAVLRPF